MASLDSFNVNVFLLNLGPHILLALAAAVGVVRTQTKTGRRMRSLLDAVVAAVAVAMASADGGHTGKSGLEIGVWSLSPRLELGCHR